MIRNSEQCSIGSNIITSTVKYEVKEDPFAVPIRFKREVPLNKNIFELHEPLPKNYTRPSDQKNLQSQQMHNPLAMDSATLKLLLLQKMNSYVSMFSISLSIFQLYFVEEDNFELFDYVVLFNTCITAILACQVCLTAYFQYMNQLARHHHQSYFIVKRLPFLLIVLLAPNPWTPEANKFFHLTLLLRVYFSISYSIRDSMYYNNRSARITDLYGIKPGLTFKFACKVILNQKSINDVLVTYFCIVVFYAHCLFVISPQIPFMDCFQTVIATLPTIGYGEHNIEGVPRIVIICILFTGVPLNAFVTFVMLKQFQMTTSEKNSYILMQKLNMMEEIKDLSSNFIIHKIQRRRVFSQPDREADENFKEHFNQCKTRYRNLNPHDSIYQFNYFKDTLTELKIKMLQSNNMINVLVTRLSASQKQDKKNLKAIKSNIQ